MRILIVSNLYPPYYMGGYELRCAQVAEALSLAGHDVRVLTSRYGLGCHRRGAVCEEYIGGVRVQRLLGQYHHGPQPPVRWPHFLTKTRPQLQDAHRFLRVIREFKPDIINWWAIGGLTKAILPIPKHRGIPDLFFVEDTWLIEESERNGNEERPLWGILWDKEDKSWYWRPVLERWEKSLERKGITTRPVFFSPARACFVSDFLRAEFEAAGFHFPAAETIHGGVSVNKFLYRRETFPNDRGPVRLLYAGEITKDRGLDTVIKAVALLPQEVRSRAALSVVGEDPIVGTSFLQEVKEQVRSLRLSDKVFFAGKVPYEEMPELYRCHDLLIAPSLRKEGLPLSMVEAMLSGCGVVTTGSGGAMEIANLADLPLFPKGDAVALSRILESMIDNPQILDGLARRGQAVALQEFSLERMINRFLEALQILYETKQRENVEPFK